MPLTLRPTGLQSPAYADRQNWTVFEHGCAIGRIYEDSSKSTPAELRWLWLITRYVPPRLNVRTNDKVGSLTEAKEQFRRAWEAVGVKAAWADGYSATEYAGRIEPGIHWPVPSSKQQPKEVRSSVWLLRQRAKPLNTVEAPDERQPNQPPGAV